MEEDKRKPASNEAIARLRLNMLLTLETSYQELYTDMALMKLLMESEQELLKNLDKSYLAKILRVHANVCYANMCICAQCRASLKSKLDVEIRYNIRRCVVTAHEMYKYLYGFTEKQTLWQEVEQQLRAKYPSECESIAEAADDYLKKYAHAADGTLRNVAKHYSNNPEEFFRNMETVTERSVTDRIVALMAFLQPIHNLLVKELKGGLGELYVRAMAEPMPHQKLEVVGIGTQDKVDAMQGGIEHYASIMDELMNKLSTVGKICKEKGLDVSTTAEWKTLIENNIGLHILFIYLDTMITFRAFTWSECYSEQRQNLACLIVSVHEGFKKLYGFNENKRQGTFWNRAIKGTVLANGDEQLKDQMKEVESRLDKLSKSAILNDEGMIDAFTHNGKMKDGGEYVFAVLDYFIKPVSKEDMDDLTAFLRVMSDVMKLELAVLDVQNQVNQAKIDAMFQGYIDQLDEYKAKACEITNDPEVRNKACEMFEQMKTKMLDLKQMMNCEESEGIEALLNDARIEIRKKQDLFLKLCSLNYLNALVKKEKYKGKIGYDKIKPSVIWAVKTLMKNHLQGLCEELSINPDDDSVYLRCYGLQFSFHHVNSQMLIEEWPDLSNKEVKWDGTRLQPVAKDLYELAKDVVKSNLGQDDVRERIEAIIGSSQQFDV